MFIIKNTIKMPLRYFFHTPLHITHPSLLASLDNYSSVIYR